MINIAIIEDEKYAQQQLLDMLAALPLKTKVVAVLETVSEASLFFAGQPVVDLILSDVQLTDGLSFDIFRNKSVEIPVIFITGFDKFMLYAFETNGIDYLLKPTGKEELLKALHKYEMLEQHFNVHNQAVQQLLKVIPEKKKTRIIAKKGMESFSIPFEEVIAFYTDNRVVYMIDHHDQKFIIDKTLNELEQELNPDLFFRANRQYIINLKFVRSYRPFEKVKLSVDLHNSDRKHQVIISQVTAPYFKKWIAEA